MTVDEVIRRSSDPAVVLQFYQSIETIRKQRQIANLKRVVRVMEREYNWSPKECLQNLHQVVTDSLIVETVTVGCKGSKTGVEQEGYWIPDKEPFLDKMAEDSHDWYCFECHKPGKLSENRATEQERLALGKSLYFVVTQQKDYWTELAKKPDEEEHPYYSFFVHTHCDLEHLQMDCHNCVFKSDKEFLAKALLIRHNYSVALGPNHSLTKLAQEFIEDCEHTLQELKLCKNCFYLSNNKPMKDWFCKPCDPPHQVVWAKQKGFDFWPAKVIQVEDHRIDVRFFGRRHPRAWITIDAVRDISVSPASLKAKRKQQWKQACDEMKEYIRQCECALGKEEAAKIILSDSPYGIGKNSKLLAAMEKANRSPTSNNSTPVKNMADSTDGHENGLDDNDDVKSNDHDDFDHVEENCEADVKPLPTTPSSHDKTGSPPPKRAKMADHSRDISQQVLERKVFSSEEQNILSELKSSDCNCKARYETILMKFKDYIVESNKLDKGKMLRAAAIESANEQDLLRSKLSEEFEEKIREMKKKHEEELKEAKMKNWCKVCLNEVLPPCCKAVSCCVECKDKPNDHNAPSPNKRRSARGKP